MTGSASNYIGRSCHLPQAPEKYTDNDYNNNNNNNNNNKL